MTISQAHSVQVRLPQQDPRPVTALTRVGSLLSSPSDPDTGLAYLAALVNQEVCSLEEPLTVNCELLPLTFLDRHGSRVYRHTSCFLLARAVAACFPEASFHIEHSLGNAFYCSFALNGSSGIRAHELEAIREVLMTSIADDLPIVRTALSYAEAEQRLQEQGLEDKLNLLQYRNPPSIPLYECDGFAEAGLGVLAPSSGCVPELVLHEYGPGFVLQFPEWNQETSCLEVPPFEPKPHLFQVFQEHREWGSVTGISTIGDLNRCVAGKQVKELIRISETRHDQHLVKLADRIATAHDRVRWILMAGPSSAGKTTTSKRLMLHLKVNGLRPVRLELDHYFRGRSHTPRHEDGSYDFEHLETIHLELLNDHLDRLDRGEEIELPTFNFFKGEPEFLGNTLRLDEDQVVVIEGIHALNPALTPGLPGAHKFRIFINALTQLQLDNTHRLSTTDLRLIRRMVRDIHLRGHNAVTTLGMWPSVRLGEKRWIYPFQQEADATFNSSLDYELAVLKPYAEPMLHTVKPIEEVYGEARRLQDFLGMVVGAQADHVPDHSVLREFIGGSMYQEDH
jgi:uridine kinase